MKGKWLFNLACILAVLAATGFAARPAQAAPTQPPDQIGPYRAGFTFQIFYDETRPGLDESGRPIVSYIWYPADQGEPADPALYPFDPLGLWGVGTMVPSTHYEMYGVDPAYAGLPVSSAGPFPLVIFSSGLTDEATEYVQIGARLASHGFVVVALSNFGDGSMGEPTLPDEEYYPWTAIDRVFDIQWLITHMLELSQDPDSLFYQAINPEKIAASGHSWGGLAALLVASGIDEFCALDPAFFHPSSCVSIAPDPRVKAIVPVDGGGWLLRIQDLERITVPHLGIGQEWDANSTWDWHAREHFAIQGHPNFRLDIADGNHMSFTSTCVFWNIWHDIGWISEDQYSDEWLMTWFCQATPEIWETAQRLTSMYMIAFLKTVLGVESYQFMLTPGYALAHEPFAEFFVTEKGNPNTVDVEWPDWPSYFIHQPGRNRGNH